MAKNQALFVRPVQLAKPLAVKPAKVPVVQAPRENNFRKFMPLAPNKPRNKA